MKNSHKEPHIMDNDAINTVIKALKDCVSSIPAPKEGFHVVEYFVSNDAHGVKEVRRSVRIHVWENRTQVCWGWDNKYITRTKWSHGQVKWESSVGWLTEAQCQRFVELDGDWLRLRNEMIFCEV